MVFHLFKINSHTYTVKDNDGLPTTGGSDMSVQHLQLWINQKQKVDGRLTIVYYTLGLRLGNWEAIKIINVTDKKPFTVKDLFIDL